MRLIDADATPSMGISNFSIMFRKVIDDMPTVDLWHYPSKGEYPKEHEPVCALVDGFNKPMIVNLFEGDNKILYWQDCWDFCIYKANKVKCWQYIVPPRRGV